MLKQRLDIFRGIPFCFSFHKSSAAEDETFNLQKSSNSLKDPKDISLLIDTIKVYTAAVVTPTGENL